MNTSLESLTQAQDKVNANTAYKVAKLGLIALLLILAFTGNLK